MKLEYSIIKLKMRETFSIAYGAYNERKTLVVTLSYAGKKGYGECVEIDYYGIRLQDFVPKLALLQSELALLSIKHPKEFFLWLAGFSLPSFLLSALDCAYWDLYGKLENQSFIELNALPNLPKTESSITIPIATINEQVRKIESSHWSKFKVKCKSLNIKDLEKLNTLGKPIAIDANASFTVGDCLLIQKTAWVQNFSYFEQPLPIGQFQHLDAGKFALWMADEDAQNQSVLPQLSLHYAAINIKLMKCGGLTPALDMIKKAKSLGFKVMLGCMTESSVGISAACALSGLLDFADLDGANLIANDFAHGSFVENGKIILSDAPGLGISLF